MFVMSKNFQFDMVAAKMAGRGRRDPKPRKSPAKKTKKLVELGK